MLLCRAFLVIALSLASTNAIELEPRQTPAPACQAYPVVNSKLSACPTVTAFCESILGTGVFSAATVTTTTTIPKSTFTYLKIKTRTIRSTITLPTSTTFTTRCVLPTTTFAIDRVAINAIGPSCGVGAAAPSAVIAGCSCILDSTVIVTKTRRTSTTLLETLRTTTISVTSTSYLPNHPTVTNTVIVTHENCGPPANASCSNPATCYDYDYYACGSNGYDDCSCGVDADNRATCFLSGSCLTSCVYNWDCPVGSFCLYDSCCGEPVCAPADVCLGDQASTTVTVAHAMFTGVPGGVMNSGSMTDAKGKGVEGDE